MAESAHAASSTVSDEIVDANVLPSPTFVLEAEEDDQLNGRVEKEEAAHPVPTVQVTDPEFLESMDHVFSVTDSSSSSGSISDSEVEEKEEAYGHEDHQSSSNLEGDEVKEFKMSLKNLREQVNTLFKLQLIGFTRKVRTFSSVNKTIRTFLKAHSGYYYALLDESPYAKAYKKNDFMALDLQTGKRHHTFT